MSRDSDGPEGLKIPGSLSSMPNAPYLTRRAYGDLSRCHANSIYRSIKRSQKEHG